MHPCCYRERDRNTDEFSHLRRKIEIVEISLNGPKVIRDHEEGKGAERPNDNHRHKVYTVQSCGPKVFESTILGFQLGVFFWIVYFNSVVQVLFV